jgi:hypothetical protein
VAYLLIAAAAVLALCSISGTRLLRGSPSLTLLGRCPLLMYVAHLAILHWGIMPLLGEVDLATYLLVYLALLAILVGLAGAVELGKQRSVRPLPFMLRLLLGS